MAGSTFCPYLRVSISRFETKRSRSWNYASILILSLNSSSRNDMRSRNGLNLPTRLCVPEPRLCRWRSTEGLAPSWQIKYAMLDVRDQAKIHCLIRFSDQHSIDAMVLNMFRHVFKIKPGDRRATRREGVASELFGEMHPSQYKYNTQLIIRISNLFKI